jgi:hypothetical protein
MRCYQGAGPPPAPSNAQGTLVRGRGRPRSLTFRIDGKNTNLPNLFQNRHYIAYIILDELILVLAVAHAARHPAYWKERLP